jgi:two-component system, sensor histidine kinase PdtaS
MKSILLVEDEALIALEETVYLKREGYAVEHVFNGRSAIEAVQTRSGAVDLVLMDIDLGKGMDGTEAAKEILKHHDIPILFLSAHTEKEIVDKTEKITSYGYVVKNSGEVVLLASIKMAFRLHEAHKALATSEEKYSKAFHISPDSININRLSDGAYLAVNQGFTEITGYAAEEVIGRSSVDPEVGVWADEDDRRRLVALLQKDGEVANFEAKFRMKLGQLRHGLMSARVLTIDNEQCILSITRDITDRRNAQLALAASNAALTSLLRAAPLAIVGVDRAGNILIWNSAAEKLFGWTAAEVIGRPNPIVPPDRSGEYAQLRERVLVGEHIVERETVRRKRDGSLVDVSISTAAIPGDVGQIPERIAIITDITERKRSEEAVRRLLKQEEVLRKELQHRVKNNLNIVSSLIGLEIPRLKDPDSRQVFIDARSRINTMMRMYDQLNRSEDPNRIELLPYVNDLAQSLFTMYAADPARIRMALRIADILIDTKRIVPLGLILNELITNALKYAYPGGSSGEIRIQAERLGEKIAVAVSDDGVGLGEGISLETSDSLGLSLVKNLTEQIEGTVVIRSEYGVTVSITFEAVQSA